jgi:HAD superfamily hydrolase (TIGR01549 family)
MIKTVLSDFSYVLIFPKDSHYQGTLNGLYKTLTGEYNFFDYYQINQPLLEAYRSFKTQGISVNIFTSGGFQENMQVKEVLKPVFEKVYSAEQLNVSKSDPSAYRNVAKLLGKSVSEIVYVDDQLANVEAAREAGMEIVYYTGLKETIAALKQKLGMS